MVAIILDTQKLDTYARWLGSYGWYWVKDCVFTNDERYAAMGLMSKRKFPSGEKYLQYMWWKAWMERRLAVNKFRQGMATWLFGGILNLYIALFIEGSKCYILKRSFDEADQILKHKCMFIYENIPNEYKELHPEVRYKEGEISIVRKTKAGGSLPGSLIKALEAGSDKARGVTGTNAVIDEAAFSEGLIETYMAMDPAMERIQIISSPKRGPFRKFFYSLTQD
jgi:hypothetical protein